MSSGPAIEGHPAQPSKRPFHRAALVALVVLAVLAGTFRLHAQGYDYRMVDEPIPVAVISHVQASGTPDTDWARTDLPPDFRYHQFNFSSYHLAAWGLTALMPDPDPAPPQGALLVELRRLNALFGALAVLLAGLIGHRLGGTVAGALAALLTALHPALVQDALYARPEAFTTVLTALLFFLATGVATTTRCVGAGLLAGLLVACKVTFVALVPFVGLALWLGMPAPMRWRKLPLFAGAVIAGFALGAPYALLAPVDYLHGIHYLIGQYAGAHWPHAAADSSIAGRLMHSGRYLVDTMGWPVLLAFALGTAVCVRGADRRTLACLVGIGATAAYFLQSHVFFERNLSHALPFAFAIAGAGLAWLLDRLRPRVRPAVGAVITTALVLVTIAPSAVVTKRLTRDALPGRVDADVAVAEAALQADGYALVASGSDPAALTGLSGLAAEFCGRWVVRIQDFGDVRTRQQLARLAADRVFAEVRRVPGAFHGLQVSTLQTYHGGDTVYLAPPARTHCRLTLDALPAETTGPAAPPRVTGDATRNGHHPGAVGVPRGAAVFGTWSGSDAHRGTIVHDGLLCSDQRLPLVAGPTAEGVRLDIDIVSASGSTVRLFSGPPPRGADRWIGLGVVDPFDDCPRVRVTAVDANTAWGTWIGLGAPVRVVSPLASGDRSP